MLPTDDRPQTVAGALGKIFLSGVLLALISSVTHASGVDVAWNAEAFRRGCFLGLVFVCLDFHRQPVDRRLAPVSAMALGLVSLGGTLVALQRAPRPSTDDAWIGWLAVLVMAAVPLSLVAAAVLSFRRGRGVAA